MKFSRPRCLALLAAAFAGVEVATVQPTVCQSVIIFRHIAGLTLIPTLILSLSSALLAIVAWRWWPDLGLGLAAERAPLGWLQSNWLIACATAASLRTVLPGGTRIWTVMGGLIFLAALDERFMIHEQLQEGIADGLLASVVIADARLAERLAQGLTAVYAIAGLLAAMWLRKAANPAPWAWMRAGIVVGIVAIGLDLASDELGLQVIEEVIEFAAETLMLCGLVTEVRSAVSR